MYIKKLTLSHFGKFHKKEIELNSNINVIYGENEAGKSTLHSFFRGMLFGIEKQRGRAGKDDLYTKYQPMDMPGAYEGSMEFSYQGEDYRIFRCFYQKEKKTQIIKISNGNELKSNDGKLSFLIPELTENAYRNTISIEQLRSKTDSELVSEVRNYIANLSTSKTSEVDVVKALNTLMDKKKALEATKIEEKIKAVYEEIQVALERENQMDEASKERKNMVAKSERMEQDFYENWVKEVEPKLKRISEYPGIRQKYERFKELEEEISNLDERITQVSEVSNISFEGNVHLENENQRLDVMTQQERKIEDEIENITEMLHRLGKKQKSRLLGALLLVVVGGTISVTPLLNKDIAMIIVFGLMLSGILTYLIMYRHIGKKIKQLKNRQKELGNENLLIKNNIKSILLHQKYEEKNRIEYDSLKSEKKKKQDAIGLDIINYMKYFSVTPNVTWEAMEQLNIEVKRFQEHCEKMKQAHEEEKLQLAIQMDRLERLSQQYENNENVLCEKQIEYDELLNMQKEQEEELTAIMMTINTIKELSTEIHENFGSSFSSKISNLMSEISGGRYTKVTVDENLNVKVLYEERYVPLERLSVGTIEQVYFALRLTIADLFFKGEEMPLLLDDSFAYYDDKRVSSVLQMLSSMTNRQIIIFTCHHREQQLLSAAGIPFTYIEL